MHITVKGKNFDVPSHLREEAIDKLTKVTKAFDRFIDMEIVFSEESNPRISEKYHCEVVAHAKGHYLRAEATGTDPLSATDRARAKLQRQVRKLKTKIVDRSQRAAPMPAAVGVPAEEE